MLAGITFSTTVTSVAACAFDMVKPERSTIDWIVDAESLVLARPSAINGFSFSVVEVLFGGRASPPIPHLVDSVSRSRLAAKPSETVLFSRVEGGEWRRVAFVDEGFRKVLDVALENKEAWTFGMTKSRVAFVESLQDTTDPRIRKLVISELDKVAYEDLKSFDLRIPEQELLQQLWSRDGYPYQAITALLLGISGSGVARDEINAYIERVNDWDSANNLGAFSAALIEVEGVKGVETLAAGMLTDPAQPTDKIEQIVMALSVHHQLADPKLQSAIASVVADLVTMRPDTAAVVARQFALRSDWSQAAVLEPVVRDRNISTMNDLMTVSVYLAKARDSTASVKGESN